MKAAQLATTVSSTWLTSEISSNQDKAAGQKEYAQEQEHSQMTMAQFSGSVPKRNSQRMQAHLQLIGAWLLWPPSISTASVQHARRWMTAEMTIFVSSINGTPLEIKHPLLKESNASMEGEKTAGRYSTHTGTTTTTTWMSFPLTTMLFVRKVHRTFWRLPRSSAWLICSERWNNQESISIWRFLTSKGDLVVSTLRQIALFKMYLG